MVDRQPPEDSGEDGGNGREERSSGAGTGDRAGGRARAKARRDGRGGTEPQEQADPAGGTGRARRSAKGYEFSAAQNQVFSQLQLLMKITAAAQLLASLLACVSLWRPVGLLPNHVGLVLVAIVALPIVVAVWTFRAAAHFQSIVETRGADIDHLMRALGELRKLYLLQVGIFALSLVLALVLFVMGFAGEPPGGAVPPWAPS